MPRSGKSSGELRLDSLEKMIHGGESGPAVVPGKPTKVPCNAVKYESLEMPPTGKLDDDKISLFPNGFAWEPLGLAPSAARVATKVITLRSQTRSETLGIHSTPSCYPATITDLDSSRISH